MKTTAKKLLILTNTHNVVHTSETQRNLKKASGINWWRWQVVFPALSGYWEYWTNVCFYGCMPQVHSSSWGIIGSSVATLWVWSVALNKPKCLIYFKHLGKDIKTWNEKCLVYFLQVVWRLSPRICHRLEEETFFLKNKTILCLEHWPVHELLWYKSNMLEFSSHKTICRFFLLKRRQNDDIQNSASKIHG